MPMPLKALPLAAARLRRGPRRLPSGVVHLWRLDEGAGVAREIFGLDATDNNTVLGGIPLHNQSKGSRDFERDSSEYLSVAHNVDLRPANRDWTLAGWFQVETFPVADLAFGGKGTATQTEYVAQIENPGRTVQIFFRNSGDTAYTTLNPAGAVSAGTPYPFRIWHDAGADQVGLQWGTQGTTTAAHDTGGVLLTTGTMYIGGNQEGAANWDGLLDTWGIWFRVWTADEWTSFRQGAETP